jgi:hypothetical protein
MIKPDWSKAPKWAKWVAEDEDGVWHWYEKKPVILTKYCRVWDYVDGEVEEVKHFENLWKYSLSRRPTKIKKTLKCKVCGSEFRGTVEDEHKVCSFVCCLEAMKD